MADAIDFSKTQRIVLLVDINPLLQSPNPNPNYITSILTISKIILSFPRLSASLFSFKLFFSSLSSLDSASTLHRLLPNYDSVSLSFNSPSQTLDSLSDTLNSISSTELTYSSSSALHIASSLLQLAQNDIWESDVAFIPGKINNDLSNIRSNLIILLSPVARSIKALAEFLSVDVNDEFLRNLNGFGDKFRAVNDAFSDKDIHFCWVDIHSHKKEAESNESEQQSAHIANEIRKFGWGFCSTDSIVLGSALVSFGLIYPSIGISSKFLNSHKLDKRIRGQLSLEILDVHGKPLECKCCDLELMPLEASPNPRSDDIIRTREVSSSKDKVVNFVNTFLGNSNNGIIKLHVTAVQRYTMCEKLEEFTSDHFLVQTAQSGKREKDGLDNFFANRVLELLASEKFEFFEKQTDPTWPILLDFLYRQGYWALVSISNKNRDSYMGILKPFTVHSAVLLFLDNNNILVQKDGVSKLPMIENVVLSQGDTDSQKGDTESQKGTSSSQESTHVGNGKRKKMKKHTLQDLTWTTFCNAAYTYLDVDLSEVYFATGFKKSKKLKFLKCWMKEMKNKSFSYFNIPDGSCPTVHKKETDVVDEIMAASANHQESKEHLSMQICPQQSRIEEDAAIVSCSETSETFFSSLPNKIRNGLESEGVDLKILAERLVNSSIYWLSQKHKTMENLDESCSTQVDEIIKLLLIEPKDMKEHKDNNPSSTSEYLAKAYELQVLLRMEILQSEYAGSMKGSIKKKLVKQIRSLLAIAQYLVDGGFHGDTSLYDYVERTIKPRYSENLGDVVKKIYDEIDLFGEENEEQVFIPNSSDSNQSFREKPEKTANKMIQIQDSFSVEDESSNPFSNMNDTKLDHAQKLNEARERREKARKFVSFTSRVPVLQRVWAPKQSKSTKVKPVTDKESKRKKQRRAGYSVVCETPLTGQEKKDERGGGGSTVYKALFQD